MGGSVGEGEGTTEGLCVGTYVATVVAVLGRAVENSGCRVGLEEGNVEGR